MPITKIPNYSPVKYQKEAWNTWDDYTNPENRQEALLTYVNGTLSCFCEDEYERYGFAAASKWYRDDGYDQLPKEMLALIEENDKKHGIYEDRD